MPVVLSGTNGVTFPDSSLQAAAASPNVLKNRIINGDMRIDQRNAGASVTNVASGGTYIVDRWQYIATQASKFTIQQNAGSVTPPAGFSNYLGITSSSAYSIVSTDYNGINQFIEGFNFADLAWGTADAKTVTISFWVRSSLTGTFGGALSNNAFNRSYPFTYTISVANTWELKSVTVAGDTSGTWVGSTNGIGLRVYFGLGVGSTYNGTAGAWTGAGNFSATGATSVVGTNGATWYVTGVQLEQNTSATPFERRLYGQELANCYRYYWQDPVAGLDTPYGDATYNTVVRQYFMPANMRVAPTITQTGSVYNKSNIGAATTFGLDAGTSNTNQTNLIITATGTGRTYLYRPVQFSAEL
jgi:hypothetical protein